MITEGTIIQGTLRPQDLIPAFMAELVEHDAARYKSFHAEIDSYAWDEEDHAFWHSEFAADILSDLFDALDAVASESGMYFGNIDGDGSDFGFWRDAYREED